MREILAAVRSGGDQAVLEHQVVADDAVPGREVERLGQVLAIDQGRPARRPDHSLLDLEIRLASLQRTCEDMLR